MKQKSKKINIKKGFTLVEVIVAISLFSAVLVMASGIFGGFVRNYKFSKEVQRNLENAQFAMSSIAKTLRTSTLVEPSTNPNSIGNIVVYDNSTGECYKFAFVPLTSRLTKAKENPTTPGDPTTCPPSANPANYATIEDMVYKTNAQILGIFSFPKITNKAGVNDKVGRITISMQIGNPGGAVIDTAYIQTSVSLRDYSRLN